jgi:ATP-binding cassette, subfamily B, heavy metal transporter
VVLLGSLRAQGVADGRLTVGDVVLFISLVGTLMGPLYSFGSVYDSFSRNFVDMEALFMLMDQEPAVKVLLSKS